MRKNHAVLLLAMLLTPWWTGTAFGQEDEKKATPFAGSPLEWGIDPIIELNVRHMTRHYNLTKEQEDYTRQLMTHRVKRFLKDYEPDVRAMWSEYWYYQKNRELPSPEVAKDWAARGRPLVTAIRKEILDGNMQWRRILNDDQRKKHDQDLDIMKQQFDRFEQRMDRWSKGMVDPADVGKVSDGVVKITRFEDAWEYRVRTFCQAYNLDAGQQETAYSILRDVKERAAAHRQKYQKDFAKLEADYAALTSAAPHEDDASRNEASEKRQQLDKERGRLEHELRVVLWNELLQRLDKIPTEAQQRARKDHLAKLDDLGTKKAAGGTTKPAGTTQPAAPEEESADTQPAVAAKSEP